MSIWGKITDFAHEITGIPTAEQKRNAQTQMNEQINNYRQQTELTRQEIAAKQGEEAFQKRRIEEKQIRALRRNYRPQGLLGVGNTQVQDQSTQLGG